MTNDQNCAREDRAHGSATKQALGPADVNRKQESVREKDKGKEMGKHEEKEGEERRENGEEEKRENKRENRSKANRQHDIRESKRNGQAEQRDEMERKMHGQNFTNCCSPSISQLGSQKPRSPPEGPCRPCGPFRKNKARPAPARAPCSFPLPPAQPYLPAAQTPSRPVRQRPERIGVGIGVQVRALFSGAQHRIHRNCAASQEQYAVTLPSAAHTSNAQ